MAQPCDTRGEERLITAPNALRSLSAAVGRWRAAWADMPSTWAAPPTPHPLGEKSREEENRGALSSTRPTRSEPNAVPQPVLVLSSGRRVELELQGDYY